MTTQDLYLSRAAIQLLSTRLRELRDWVCESLDDTICREVAFTDRNPGNRTETPLVFNENASEAATILNGTLRAWVEHTVTHSTHQWPGTLRTTEYAHWLDRNLIDLAKTEEAPQADDEITDAWRQAKRAIDRPEPQEFAGPCQSTTPTIRCEGVYCRRGTITKTCSTCGIDIDIPTVKATTEDTMSTRLFTKAELRTALVMVCKRPISRSTIDSWIRRGRLTDRGGKFLLADALSLIPTQHTEHTA